ncbi:MAG: sigma-70 family RNA polymerase sigma factor [Thermomicrobia bacterium]|nr:sigma-70 family RNA polymerase sigma factor [Thermomicrobia bacterium]MCA1723764.1 sigma-70 family RNA polymerase sigma factor [Thermomicrobia bacterium]
MTGGTDGETDEGERGDVQQVATIERAMTGQLPPFDTVFQRYYRRVFAILTRIVGPDEADDLAQETFLRFHDRPPLRRTDDDDAVGAWLYRVATNLGFNAIRGHKRRAAREERVTRAELPLQRPLDPEYEAVRREERALVQSVLVAMPERARAVLTLRQAGCSYAEIAAAVGIAPGSVGTTLVRAEALFRQRYEAVTDRRTAGA